MSIHCVELFLKNPFFVTGVDISWKMTNFFALRLVTMHVRFSYSFHKEFEEAKHPAWSLYQIIQVVADCGLRCVEITRKFSCTFMHHWSLMSVKVWIHLSRRQNLKPTFGLASDNTLAINPSNVLSYFCTGLVILKLLQHSMLNIYFLFFRFRGVRL